VYLAFVAFLPFPTDLVGSYVGNPVSVALFGGTLAMVSALEVVQFAYAWRRGHTKQVIPTAVAHWGIVASLVPVVVILVSMPIAFFWSSVAALVFWAAVIPDERLVDRFKPAETKDFFAGA
jgi:TMEM175 potassium channel family protein